MSERPLLRSPFTILALGTFAILGLVLNAWGTGGSDPTETDAPECRGLTPEACAEVLGTGQRRGTAQSEALVLGLDEACGGAGYLCAEVEATGSLQLMRWPEGTERIRILVPEPEGLPPALAREFQRAAVRGIRSWHGHPIPLSIRTRGSGEAPDITLDWIGSSAEGRLGRAQLEWSRRGNEMTFRVVGFTVATHTPGGSPEPLTPDQVEVVAAHEMGHALGLPHSDDPRDVMYPRNTATRLTVRDFRTLEALYSLPNGTEIRRGP